jgi:alkylated DNA repair dioxygenase AlkB
MTRSKGTYTMDLLPRDSSLNLLPCDGIANYYGAILLPCDAADYFQALMTNIPWKNDETIIYGKHIITARKVAWYGDDAYAYSYSGTTRVARAWNRELRALRSLVEEKSGEKFNSCLCNLYHDGSEGMAWHSDDEDALGKDTAIASLSLGAERKFSLRHKRAREIRPISIQLEDGSLLVMKGATQTNWQHTVPKSAKVTSPRINLTFRSIVRLESIA